MGEKARGEDTFFLAQCLGKSINYSCDSKKGRAAN